MARRFSAPYQSEPVSGLASWARNLAVFSVVAVLVSILIVRFGFLEIKPALATFFGALAIATRRLAEQPRAASAPVDRLDQYRTGPRGALASHHGEGPAKFRAADQGPDPDVGGEQQKRSFR